VRIVNNLGANSDRNPPSGVYDRTLTYTYDVEYTPAGDVRPGVGDFISAGDQARFAPSGLFHVIGAQWGHHNPEMSVAEVMADDGSN
jgi:hypothetical protein